jgi:hypothetical protein
MILHASPFEARDWQIDRTAWKWKARLAIRRALRGQINGTAGFRGAKGTNYEQPYRRRGEHYFLQSYTYRGVDFCSKAFQQIMALHCVEGSGQWGQFQPYTHDTQQRGFYSSIDGRQVDTKQQHVTNNNRRCLKLHNFIPDREVIIVMKIQSGEVSAAR